MHQGKSTTATTTAAAPTGRRHPYLRLDTLEPYTPPDPVLWGAPLAARVRRSALFHEPGPGRVPFARVSAHWAIRLAPNTPTEARAARVAFLLDRDGDGCLHCGRAVDPVNCHVEHVVALSCGGPEHAANLALSHPACNATAGGLSAAEKLRHAGERRRDPGAVVRQLADLAGELLEGGPLDTREAGAVALASALLFGKMRRYREAVEVLELVAPALYSALGVSLPPQYFGQQGAALPAR